MMRSKASATGPVGENAHNKGRPPARENRKRGEKTHSPCSRCLETFVQTPQNRLSCSSSVMLENGEKGLFWCL